MSQGKVYNSFLTLHNDAVPGGKDLDAFSLEGSNTLQGLMCGTDYTYQLSRPRSLRLEENKKMTRLQLNEQMCLVWLEKTGSRGPEREERQLHIIKRNMHLQQKIS